MEQFNLETWLQDKSRKVVTRLGKPVRIVCWDASTKNPIYGFVEGDDGITNWRKDGRFSNLIDNVDLFFADEEESTEFEKELEMMMASFSNGNLGSDIRKKMPKQKLHNYAHRLLDLARKEFEKENSEFKPKFTYNEKDYSELGNKLIEFRNNTPLFSVSYRDGEGRKIILYYEKEILNLARKELEENYYTKVVDDRMVFKSELHATDLQTAYDMGKQDVLEDLPKLKKIPKDISRKELLDMMHKHIVLAFNDCVDYYYIDESDLRKLPKEE